VHNALRCRVGDRAPGEDELEMKAYSDFSHSLSWKAVGGSSRMQINRIPDAHSLEQSDVWYVSWRFTYIIRLIVCRVVISLDRVHSTLDLLCTPRHMVAYRRCQELIFLPTLDMKPLYARSPSLPIITLPGRFTYQLVPRSHVNRLCF
jgi:hypothetical protein